MPDPTLKNVFEAILKYGHDEDFAPKSDDAFKATQAPAGTREKLEVLADRVRRGQPLWHDDDRADYSGLTGRSARATNCKPSIRLKSTNAVAAKARSCDGVISLAISSAPRRPTLAV